ncbi:MAG: hypothetical protein RIB84_27290 [Sneathiellaceae bacterium]
MNAIMRKALLFALPLLATACMSSERTYLPTGQAVNRLTCSLSGEAMKRCYQAAGEICGERGYTIYDWDGSPWATPYPDPAAFDDYAMVGTATLLMACHSGPRQG